MKLLRRVNWWTTTQAAVRNLKENTDRQDLTDFDCSGIILSVSSLPDILTLPQVRPRFWAITCPDDRVLPAIGTILEPAGGLLLEMSGSENRADIFHVGGVVYTHWHPDHTAGWRVLELLNTAPEGGGVHSTMSVYVPRSVWDDFERQKQVGMAANLNFLARCGLVCINIMEDECPILIRGMQIEAIPMKGTLTNMYAFLLEQGGTRTLLALDHLLGWEPPPLRSLSHLT